MIWCRYYITPKWNRNSEISRPILAFRPRPITARFFEVLNKTSMSACSDINQSILAQQSTHLLACSITIDTRVWVICTLAALHITLTTNPWPPFTLRSVWSLLGRLFDEVHNYNGIKMQNRLINTD